MKIVYGVPYVHEDPTFMNGVVKAWSAAGHRNLEEMKIAQKIKELNPNKIFWEGGNSGDDLSQSSIQMFEIYPSDSTLDSLQRTFGMLAKGGVKIEGLDSENLGGMHLRVISLQSSADVWKSNVALRALDDLKEGRPTLVRVSAIGRIIFIATVVRLVFSLSRILVFRPWGWVLMQLRDLHMGRCISSSAVEGINVAVYGAAHRPFRFVRGHNFEKRYLYTREEASKVAKDYAARVAEAEEQAKEILRAEMKGIHRKNP